VSAGMSIHSVPYPQHLVTERDQIATPASVGLEYDYIRLRASDAAACLTGTAGSIFSCPGGTQPLLFTGFHADVNEVGGLDMVAARISFRPFWGMNK